jgi:hypothetical protein
MECVIFILFSTKLKRKFNSFEAWPAGEHDTRTRPVATGADNLSDRQENSWYSLVQNL